MSLVPFSFTFSVGCPVPTVNIVISIASYTYPGSGGSGTVNYTLEARRQDDNSLINVNTNVTVNLRFINDLSETFTWTAQIDSGTSSTSEQWSGVNPLSSGVSQFDITGVSPTSNSGQAYFY